MTRSASLLAKATAFLPPTFILTTFLLLSCVNDEAKVRDLFEKKTGIDEATGLETYLSQGGLVRARLRAPKMQRFLMDTMPRVEFPNTIHVDFFDDSLKVQSMVDANYARYFEMQNRVFLKDSVRVYNTDGDTLHCRELWWDQNSEKFHTDKAVRIHRKDMIMIGVGLSAPQDFSTFEMYQVANSIIRVPDQQVQN